MALTRTLIQPVTLPPHINSCKIICWNVAGLRGILKNSPSIFDTLVQKYEPHIICLQETKIQESHECDFGHILPSYTKYWSSATTKKGYSGTAIFVKGGNSAVPAPITNKSVTGKQSTLMSMWAGVGGKKRKRAGTAVEMCGDITAPVAAPETADSHLPVAAGCSEAANGSLDVLRVQYDLEGHTGEGRVITLEFPDFYLVNTYVPNSGQALDRLDYRTKEWDPQLYRFLKELEEGTEGRIGKPVVLTGDLNVAHLDLDIHNPTAKHISKQSGLTPQERSSFGSLLATGFQDALRFFYPAHEGQFTWWSVRTNARPANKGLRLDYFMCSKTLFAPQHRGNGCSSGVVVKEAGEVAEANEGEGSSTRDVNDVPSPGVVDSFILHEDTVGVSDHCPIILLMKL